MSLYLCIYEGDREVDGVEVGSYADFNTFRAYAARSGAPAEPGDAGNAGDARTAFPTLLEHSDCDGSWSPDECRALRCELAALAEVLKNTPEAPIFTDVDGEPLVDRLLQLVDTAITRQLPILFQ